MTYKHKRCHERVRGYPGKRDRYIGRKDKRLSSISVFAYWYNKSMVILEGWIFWIAYKTIKEDDLFSVYTMEFIDYQSFFPISLSFLISVQLYIKTIYLFSCLITTRFATNARPALLVFPNFDCISHYIWLIWFIAELHHIIIEWFYK